jgi:AAA+ ATPase superfamily predicted ATPase
VPATDQVFFDREAELARLSSLLARVKARAPEWLAIVGPRKVGKTSLILEWERRLADPQLACVVIDVMEVAPPSRELFRSYALRIVDRVLGDEAGAGLIDLASQPAKYRSALQLSPRFDRLPPNLRAEVLELPERSLDGPGIASCLELPERIAKALDLRLVIAMDEFQELASLASARPKLDPFAMMRSSWQRHRHVAYVISGSAPTMLTELVTSQRSPFFQHFSLMELGPFRRDDAIGLLVEAAPPDRPIDRSLAGRMVDVVGGHPFYLQIVGETLTAMPPPIDDDAFKEALGQLLFVRTGRLALYFENEYRRAIGRSSSQAAILAAVAIMPRKLGELATAIKAATGATTSYLDRLGDVVTRGDDDRWRLADPVFGMWLRWRSPGGAAVPMTVVGDEAERAAAEALARLGFDLVYQSRASRGAFDLLATRGARQLGVQVKRTELPAHIRASDWKRMHAEGTRLGWQWLVAAVTPEGTVHFLDPGKARARRGITLPAAAVIDNVLLWLDLHPKGLRRRERGGGPPGQRRTRPVKARAGSARGSRSALRPRSRA